MSKKNYYKILNVSYTATSVEIKKAYRRLAHLYHPDKARNDTAKTRFEDIKEAYETLVDPTKRKKYNLTFDNFSYKKEEFLTPYQVLQKIKVIHAKLQIQDPHRLNLDKIQFQLLEILSERNIQILQSTVENDTVREVIKYVLEIAKPLNLSQFKNIMGELRKISSEEDLKHLQKAMDDHKWRIRWNMYKIAIASAIGILLCIIIYFVSRK